jgi:hypothetical protein
MTETPIAFSSNINEVSRLEFLLTIARAKGSHLSIKEIGELTGLLPEGSDLNSIRNLIPNLDSQYELQGGLLLEKQLRSGQTLDETLEDSNQRRARAERYIEYAREFSLLTGRRWIRVLSVAGSTSYKAPSGNDDIDIFCVTERDSLWIYLTKALLLARVFKLSRPSSPRFCFSCALDEEYAERLFGATNDALFARDALTAQILQGSAFYSDLLWRTQWLSDYFPNFYRMKRAQYLETAEKAEVIRSIVVRKVLNRFLFLTVGNYVRLRSILLNRALRKKGWHDSFFTILSSPNHCIFESQGYRKLRAVYSRFKLYTSKQESFKTETDPEP